MACSEATIYPQDNAPIVIWAEQKVSAYHNFADQIQVQVMLVADSDLVKTTCHNANAGACNKSGLIIIDSTFGNLNSCLFLIHELNHSASYIATGDWDYNHLFSPELYSGDLPLKWCNEKPESIGWNL